MWSTRSEASMNDIDILKRRLRMAVEAIACRDRLRILASAGSRSLLIVV